MNILQETALAQSIYIIPRSYPSEVTVKITQDESKTTDTYTVTTNTSGGYLVLTDYFTLKEDYFYNMLVYDGDDLIYFGRIFCTNQTDYDINNGKYTEREHDNDYIVYE